jgi:hypothetical protein
MEVKDFIDKLEDFVFQVTPDIEELEAVMVAVSKELSTRYLKTSSNSDYTKCCESLSGEHSYQDQPVCVHCGHFA